MWSDPRSVSAFLINPIQFRVPDLFDPSTGMPLCHSVRWLSTLEAPVSQQRIHKWQGTDLLKEEKDG